MSTFFNTPTPSDPVTPKPASEASEIPAEGEGSPSKASFRVPPADSVPVLHFREAADTAVTKLNADLGLSLDAIRFARRSSK